MTEPVRLISVRRLAVLEASRRRLRWALLALACAAVGLLVNAAARPKGLELPHAARPAEASSTEAVRAARAPIAAPEDPLYDEFLQEYAPLRDDAELRRYLTAQVLGAAAAHRVDPDLLFALIAAESSFDSQAVSPRGARGLGQMQFATARAVAPGAVRRPEDLHDVPRNLYATALHLGQLLTEGRGDLRGALRAYYAGAWGRRGRGGDRYVARVATHYALLKARRAYHEFTAATPAPAAPGFSAN